MISVKATDFFFDRKVVIDAVGKAAARNLSKAGAYIRTSARSSIRKRKRVSKPGEPPSSHTGHLKEYIWFAFDPRAESVVVGPVGFNQKSVSNGEIVSGVVPVILEKGGTIGIREVLTRWGWQTRGRSRRREQGLPTRVRKASYEARPYMGPAFEKNKDKFKDIWADSIK